MAVLVQFLIIKKDMKSLVIKLVIPIILSVFAFQVLAESHSYYKIANEARRKGDWETSAKNYMLYLQEKETDSDKKYNMDEAFYEIGHFYAHGHYFHQNIDSAIFYLEKAVQYDKSQAARFLSDIYYFSKYKHEDKQKSFSWLETSAEMGNIKSLYELAELYCNGYTYQLKDTTIVVEKAKDAHSALLSPVKGGYSYTTYVPTKNLIKYDFIEIDLKKAYEYFEYSLNGYTETLNPKIGRYELAIAYMDGTYFEQNYQQAVEYFKMFVPSISELNEMSPEIDLGEKILDALWRLQLCYRFGRGVTCNEIRANEYARMAAKFGHKKAIELVQFLDLE